MKKKDTSKNKVTGKNSVNIHPEGKQEQQIMVGGWVLKESTILKHNYYYNLVRHVVSVE